MIKVDLRDHFGNTLKHLTKQNSSPYSLHGNIENNINDTVYTLIEKN